MKDLFTSVPRWALVLIIAIMSLGLNAGFSAFQQHEAQQSADVKALTAAVATLAEATSNLKTVTENNRAESRWLHRND